MKDIDDTKQPLLAHLIELRRRLLWSLATLVLFFFICLTFARDIFAVLVQPLLRAGQGKLIYTDVFEAFFVQVKVALFAALMLSFPMIAGDVPLGAREPAGDDVVGGFQDRTGIDDGRPRRAELRRELASRLHRVVGQDADDDEPVGGVPGDEVREERRFLAARDARCRSR